ncbi:hypothetical protein ZIOFF_011460 [Zingiber officinale]|uniref:RING-type domain-containing protein n=1 Tax=Zingiber officinale TaxID=94328 RepID=A0A8J5LT55_ZINOF|nr:hypothetical protein ZIOFF_011460 [Zingiber officinale]
MAASSVSMSNVADGAVFMEISGWEANTNGYLLTMEADVATRSASQGMNPPQFIFRFCLRTISPSTRAVESAAYFTIDQPYQNILSGAAWDEETRWMLSHVAASHVRTADDLALLILAFRRYTRAVLDLFPITELSMVEFFSVIEIPPAVPSTSTGRLHYFVPLETRQYFFEDDESVRGPTSAPAAAVEGLQMKKITEELGVCSICLEDFNIMSHVLEMPCRHIFHRECLKEWLARSNTCPLCRFSLTDDANLVATRSI